MNHNEFINILLVQKWNPYRPLVFT